MEAFSPMLDLFAVFSAYPSLLQEKTQLPHQPFFVSVVEKDASSVSPGACFVAYRGERADGHCGIQEALRRGAAALVIEDAAARPENCPVPCFSVNDGQGGIRGTLLCRAAQPPKQPASDRCNGNQRKNLRLHRAVPHSAHTWKTGSDHRHGRQ